MNFLDKICDMLMTYSLDFTFFKDSKLRLFVMLTFFGCRTTLTLQKSVASTPRKKKKYFTEIVGCRSKPVYAATQIGSH